MDEFAFTDLDKFNQMLKVCIRDKRRQLNYSYSDLAKMVGQEESYWQGIENGEAQLTYDLLEPLQQCLGIDPQQIQKMISVAHASFLNDLYEVLQDECG